MPLSPLDAAFDDRPTRYVVGIDLGTTNCAVAYMDSHRPDPQIETFRVEQVVDIQTSQRADTLPSFHYELTPSESSESNSRFQFVDGSHTCVVGIFARQRGMQMPGRCVASAKSWLCHTLVDRTSDLLPWSNDEDVQLVSPVRASSRYLEHIRRAWDREHPSEPLANQDVIVTLPASFDEVARQLTIQAAKEAGLPNIILIEEPQAAFYAWLNRNQSTWQSVMRPGQSILVCDIGGGTTDFTLIRVIETAPTDVANPLNAHGDAGSTALDQSESVGLAMRATFGLHRVAVGEHLLLGGDNLDLALAKALEQRLLADSPGQEQLRPRQWDALKSQCRIAKETLLGPNPPSSYALSLPGTGSKLIENTRSVPVQLEWIKELLIEGFFGHVGLDDRPVRDAEGFQEFGLPYASEPNILKHLAAFLWDHRWAGRPQSEQTSLSDMQAARPDWILFNGGVLESSQIREAIVGQIVAWFGQVGTSTNWKPGLLEGNRLDLAVAQGAAYFGLVRRGRGVRIDARLAKAYYLLVDDSPPRAMCIVPANALPLDRFRLDEHPFDLIVGQPVQFPLMQSSTHLIHKPGEIVDVDPLSMIPLPPIRTVLELENKKLKTSIPVVLETEITEIGTLAMSLVRRAPDKHAEVSWKLEFDVRGSSNSNDASNSQSSGLTETARSTQVESAADALNYIFGELSTVAPKEGVNFLAQRIGQSRRDWGPALLREMWRCLIEHQACRKRSAEVEARWINLVGWCLRPGFGVAADDWRVHTTWRHVHNKLLHRSAANTSETIVLWRRIAGGFTQGQQRALFQDCWPRIRTAISGGSQAQSTNVTTELLRLVGSLEWLAVDEKRSVAELGIQSLAKKKLEPLHGPLLWTIGRLGSRVPIYASLQQVLSASRVQAFLDRLLAMDDAFVQKNLAMYSLCMMQLARRTDDRYRDVPASVRDRVASKLEKVVAPKLHIELVSRGGKLDEENTATIVGESLPLGFRLGTR
ncbi:MAG: Hsp70 family protein [Pirellula sp.]